MRLILIRHGQTPSNVLGALDTGVPGPPLTDLGREQAVVIRDELADCGATAVYASSMVRTQQTAAPLAEALGVTVVVRDGLREISAGDAEMATDDGSIERYLEFLSACARAEEAELPGGETTAAVISRFDTVIDEVCSAGDEVAVVFSHGAMLRAWTGRRADNLDADLVLERRLRNTGTIVLDGTPTTGWRVLTWDATPLDDTSVPTGPTGPAGDVTD